MKWSFAVMLVIPLLFSACASKKADSGSAREALESKYGDKVGAARKQELIEHFGTPEWCQPKESGGETCRFYRKKGTQWVGDNKRDKKSYEAFDELVADFDSDGVLRGFKANAQR